MTGAEWTALRLVLEQLVQHLAELLAAGVVVVLALGELVATASALGATLRRDLTTWQAYRRMQP